MARVRVRQERKLEALKLSEPSMNVRRAELEVSAKEAQLKRAQDAVDACFKSRDYEEGRKAFMEKRKPVFTGS